MSTPKPRRPQPEQPLSKPESLLLLTAFASLGLSIAAIFTV